MAASFYASRERTVARRLAAHLADWLFPVACLGCGNALAGSEPLHLCLSCRSRLGDPIVDPLDHPRMALWAYQPPIDAVIRALKFRRLDYLGRHLAAELAGAFGPALGEIDLVVPIPLHWRRRLSRGFDQAERIARPLADRLDLPFARALSRRRATRAQTRLGRPERLANLRGAFAVPRPEVVAGRRVLLVDDVATTGATLSAAAEALAGAGTRAVASLVAARTPAD